MQTQFTKKIFPFAYIFYKKLMEIKILKSLFGWYKNSVNERKIS